MPTQQINSVIQSSLIVVCKMLVNETVANVNALARVDADGAQIGCGFARRTSDT